MTRVSRLVLLIVLFLLAVAAGAWFFVVGRTSIAATLVPADTLAFAYIPNGDSVLSGYNGSQLKQLADSPNAQPLLQQLADYVGEKNLGLLRVLLPSLGGQSFIAVTHFDPANPGDLGLIAGMKPKLGRDTFDTFIQQVNAAYPELGQGTKTGHDTLLGVDYQWIQSPAAPQRICVARSHGWIVTAWGESSLQDWLERVQGKSATPSLAESTDFKRSRDRVGPGAQGLLYVNYPPILSMLTQRLTATNPALTDTFRHRLDGLGGAAVGTSFDGGEIVDRLSMLETKAAREAAGFSTTPCTFDTLKFTGPDTRLYFGTSVDWGQLWKNLQEAGAGLPGGSPLAAQLQAWAQSENVDLERNVIGALGAEYSLQVEWAGDALYPDAALYLKIDHEADFKPAVAGLIDYARKAFINSAVITEMQADGHTFATLKLIQPLPISPTVVEDGPYFGLFLNATHAVRALARDEASGLLHNADFNRQIGSRKDGACQLFFLDAPRLLDQGYRTALPYLSMGAMFNPALAAALKDRQMPPDLSWLAPMGTWGAVLRADDDGIIGYSRSGIGNQGILLALGLGSGGYLLQTMGYLPQHRYTEPVPGNPFPAGAPGSALPAAGAPPIPPAPTAPSAPPAPPTPPDATTPPAPGGSSH